MLFAGISAGLAVTVFGTGAGLAMAGLWLMMLLFTAGIFVVGAGWLCHGVGLCVRATSDLEPSGQWAVHNDAR
jgi:hypothetical protein